jgi:hypothetical protein
MDGNNSLRRVDAALTKATDVLQDSRTARTDYWLSREQVDVYKDEVKAKTKKKAPVKATSLGQRSVADASAPLADADNSSVNQPAEDDGDVSGVDDDEDDISDDEFLVETREPGDVTSGADAVTVCIERWKNAGPEAQKKMWEMFDETGVFIAVCRHGFLLVLCDMVKSGEL